MSTAVLDKPTGAVTVLVTRRVKAGHEAAFEQASSDMTAAASAFPGYLGGQLVRPDAEGSGDDSALYHVVFAFDTHEHLQGWQQSPTRSLGLAAIAPHIEAQTLRQVSGLGHWFAAPVGPKQNPPPRWKVAVVTWLGICPTVYVLFLLLGPLLAPWPLLPRVMLLTALVVLIMTWLVAPPQLTQLLKPWLYPVTRAGTA
ncbi:antibiotic biosynthesis monooxygenase [Rhodoferax ferrireducens]|uniref:antibiotic biosynthesis monooxygenase n=1 Tax=Rhodoferax ferrireducens TaxID=192843 RepID=UPI000E0DC294|nr:antibiotic biosynthesis monooxygenase [Rhodoferax ferrireducens]